MSICVGDSGLVGAAVFAAPRCARDTVPPSETGRERPRHGAAGAAQAAAPGVVHAPQSLSVSPALAGAKWCRESALDVRANVPRILMWITLSIRWSFCGAHRSFSRG
jgi:hypothetical protein